MRLFVFCLLLSECVRGQNAKQNENIESLTSIKINYWYGIIYPQNYISFNYCIQKKSEISIGVFYRNIQYEYLINWELEYAKAKYYGINFGFIPNNKINRRFSFISTYSCSFSLVTTEFPSLNKKTIEPVLLGVLYWGPKIKYRFSNKLSINFMYQIGIGYGTASTIENLYEIPAGEGFVFDLLPSFEINYFFNSK
jgi:hypothetical protein